MDAKLLHEFKTDNNIHIDNDDDNLKEYNICCSKSSIGFIHFSSQVTIFILILIFCFIQIYKNNDKDNTVYFSLISSIMALFIPPPSIRK